MAKLNLKLKTWSCDTCGYKQDFEPTPQAMKWHMVDSEPLSSQGKQWRIYAQHDWSNPTCPACLIVDARALELSNKKLISIGKSRDIGVLDGSKLTLLTPELNAPIIVTASEDSEIDTLVEATDPDDIVGDTRVRELVDVDEENVRRIAEGKSALVKRTLSATERSEYKAKTKASIQELIDRGMLDETDLPTKKIKDNLALGKLTDR